MNKCLVTKIATSINNDEIEVFGNLTLEVFNFNTTEKNIITAVNTATSPTKITIGNNITTNRGNEWVLPQGEMNTSYWVGEFIINSMSSEDKIYISNKYNLQCLDIKHMYINFNNIKYCQNLELLHYQDQNSRKGTENIEMLSNLSNLSALDFNRSKYVTGNLESLGKLIKLVRLSMANTQITGDLATLANAMFSNGRTSGTLSIAYPSSYITFRNNKVTSSGNIKFTESGWTSSWDS